MALVGLPIRFPAAAKRTVAGVDLLVGLRPARLLLAALIGAFVLALLYVLQIQSLVQMGARTAQLEEELAVELFKQEALRVELAEFHDLSTIERTALLDLDMVAIERQNTVFMPELPDGVDLSAPPWPGPVRLTEPHWWEKVLIRLNEIIHQASPRAAADSPIVIPATSAVIPAKAGIHPRLLPKQPPAAQPLS